MEVVTDGRSRQKKLHRRVAAHYPSVRVFNFIKKQPSLRRGPYLLARTNLNTAVTAR